MNYYNQKLVNRGNRNSESDIKLGTGGGDANSVSKPYLQKNPYESNCVNRPNLLPNLPYENNMFQQNFNEPAPVRVSPSTHGQNLNYQYGYNNNSITSPFENVKFSNKEDVKKDPFEGKDKEDSSNNQWNKNDKSVKENTSEKPRNKNQDNEEEEEEELPLLEELGINFEQISKRMKSVFKLYTIDPSLFENSDLSGPLLIVLSLGFTLLLAGKASFSYIYLIGIVSSLSIYLLLNIMSQHLTLDLYRTISMLGYALLPLVILSSISIFLNLRTKKGYTISFFCILWSALAASRFFEAALQMNSQRYLIAYPIFLLYSCFALVIIF